MFAALSLTLWYRKFLTAFYYRIDEVIARTSRFIDHKFDRSRSLIYIYINRDFNGHLESFQFQDKFTSQKYFSFFDSDANGTTRAFEDWIFSLQGGFFMRSWHDTIVAGHISHVRSDGQPGAILYKKRCWRDPSSSSFSTSVLPVLRAPYYLSIVSLVR